MYKLLKDKLVLEVGLDII